MSFHVLVIDDDPDTRVNLRDILELDQFQVDTAGSAREALARENWADFSVIILDRRLPDGSAESLLPSLKRLAPQAAVVVITGHADVQGAVAAIRQGAADYIVKPVDVTELRTRVGRLIERRRADEDLQSQTRILRSVMAAIHDAVMVVDRHGNILLFNPAVLQLIGPAVIGDGPERWPQLGRVYHRDRTTVCKLEELALMHALQGENVLDAEEFVRRSSGPNHPSDATSPNPAAAPAEIWVSAHASPLRGDQGEVHGAVIVWRDISERKRGEEKLLQSERLAAIGQMVTGLAHESGNALARSQSCLEMLTWEVEDRPAALDLIQRMQRAQDDLRQLYEEVRNYAAPLRLDLGDWSVAGIWRQAWDNLRVQRQGRAAVLHEETGGMELHCSVDAFRLEQVFRNILENSLAACGDPMVIDVHTVPAILEGRPALGVCVRDNGPGLSAEQKRRIFDPFFTTKTKGTGLGMAIAKRIIDAHGGTLVVGSAGQAPGAEIVITLPREHP